MLSFRQTAIPPPGTMIEMNPSRFSWGVKQDQTTGFSEGTGTTYQCFGADSDASSNPERGKHQHILVRADNNMMEN